MDGEPRTLKGREPEGLNPQSKMLGSKPWTLRVQNKIEPMNLNNRKPTLNPKRTYWVANPKPEKVVNQTRKEDVRWQILKAKMLQT